MTRYTTLTLSEVAGLVEREMVEYADALRPGDESEAILVEQLPSGSYDIVDGYHRVAGFRRWADETGRDYATVEIRILLCEPGDETEAAVAANPGPDQRAALDTLHGRAR